MAKDRSANLAPPETVISIIGPGMQVIGECHTDGTIRIEGTVQGTVPWRVVGASSASR